jgi:hypothetical protein
MKLFPCLAAFTSVIVTASPAFAQMRTSQGSNPVSSAPGTAAPSRAGDWRSGAGCFIAPRYLNAAGDSEFSVDAGYLLGTGPNAASTTAVPFPWLGQLGLQYKVSDPLEADLILGPDSLLGIRGPLLQGDTLSLGWGAFYHSEIYPTRLSTSGAGLGRAFFGLLDAIAPGNGLSETRGGQVRVEGLWNMAPLTVYLTPLAQVMSNRSSVGADFGADLDLGSLTLGYTGGYKYNFLSAYAGIQPNEFMNVFGGRYRLSDQLYLQASYMRVSWDSYGGFGHAVMGGIGYRWSLSSVSAPPSQLKTSQ